MDCELHITCKQKSNKAPCRQKHESKWIPLDYEQEGVRVLVLMSRTRGVYMTLLPAFDGNNLLAVTEGTCQHLEVISIFQDQPLFIDPTPAPIPELSSKPGA